MNQLKNITKPLMWTTTLLLAAIVAGCGGSGNGNPSAISGAGSGGAGVVGGACTGANCVSLGTAANYAILAQTGVATVPTSTVTGNVGLSPTARTGLTGWAETYDVTDTYATSAQVVAPGKLYAADNVGGTTSVDLTTAVGDMGTAYTNANGMAPAGGGLTTACPGTGALSGLTIPAGVYTCTVALSIATTPVVLSGTATDVWVIRTTGAFTTGVNAQVILAGGALAKNVFWVIGSATTTGASSHIEGIILDQTSINMGNLSSINGRLLAQTAVNLDATTVTRP
jgi:hypothetical protein